MCILTTAHESAFASAVVTPGLLLGSKADTKLTVAGKKRQAVSRTHCMLLARKEQLKTFSYSHDEGKCRLYDASKIDIRLHLQPEIGMELFSHLFDVSYALGVVPMTIKPLFNWSPGKTPKPIALFWRAWNTNIVWSVTNTICVSVCVSCIQVQVQALHSRKQFFNKLCHPFLQDFHRTVIFLDYQTIKGENLFILGGIDTSRQSGEFSHSREDHETVVFGPTHPRNVLLVSSLLLSGCNGITKAAEDPCSVTIRHDQVWRWPISESWLLSKESSEFSLFLNKKKPANI